MATRAETWTGWSSGFRLRFLVERTSVNVAQNHSVTRNRVWLESQPNNNGWYWFSNIPSTHYLEIDGATVFDGTVNRSIATGGSVLILDYSRTVPHDSDGTKTVYTYASFQNTYTPLLSGSLGLTLDRIPRATEPGFTGAFTTGAAKTISLPRAASGFTHDVAYRVGSGSWNNISTGVGTSLSWTPPHSLFDSTPNGASLACTLRVITKSGSTTIGTATKSFTLNLNSNRTPTVDAVNWTDQNPVSASTGAFIQNKSLLKGTVTASGINGSTVRKREVVVDGAAFDHAEIIIPGNHGTISASGRVTDSRGRTGTAAANFSVLPYQDPTVTGYSVRRCNSAGVPDREGQHLRVDLTANAQSVVVAGSQKNALKVVVRTRVKGNTGWTTRQTITPGLNHAGFFVVSGGGIYAAGQSYEVAVEVTDNLHSGSPVAHVALVSTAAVTMHWSGIGVGVGKMHERGALDVGPGGIYDDGLQVASWYVDSVNAADPPSSFRQGVTFGTAGPGFPTPYAVVETSYSSIHRASQAVYEKDSAQRSWYRTADADSWTPWKEVATYDGLPVATETVRGIVERATQTEVNAGTDGARFVTPATLRNSTNIPWAMAAGKAGRTADIANNIGVTLTVTLPAGRFTRAPIVTVSPGNTSRLQAVVTATSTTSFNIGLGNFSGATATPDGVYWHAVQMTSTNASG